MKQSCGASGQAPEGGCPDLLTYLLTLTIRSGDLTLFLCHWSFQNQIWRPHSGQKRNVAGIGQSEFKYDGTMNVGLLSYLAHARKYNICMSVQRGCWCRILDVDSTIQHCTSKNWSDSEHWIIILSNSIKSSLILNWPVTYLMLYLAIHVDFCVFLDMTQHL